MRWDERTRNLGRSNGRKGMDDYVHENDMDENGVLVSRKRKASYRDDTQSILSVFLRSSGLFIFVFFPII